MDSLISTSCFLLCSPSCLSDPSAGDKPSGAESQVPSQEASCTWHASGQPRHQRSCALTIPWRHGEYLVRFLGSCTSRSGLEPLRHGDNRLGVWGTDSPDQHGAHRRIALHTLHAPSNLCAAGYVGYGESHWERRMDGPVMPW